MRSNTFTQRGEKLIENVVLLGIGDELFEVANRSNCKIKIRIKDLFHSPY